MKYTNNKSEKPKTSKRNIISFSLNPSKSVWTNLVKTFLQLVTKSFSRSHKRHKIFNRNRVKVSHNFINNMPKIIKTQNKKVTSKPRDQTPKCNYRKKQNVQKKCILDLQGENGRATSINTSYHWNTRDIPIRQHFQVTCGPWKLFKVKRLT